MNLHVTSVGLIDFKSCNFLDWLPTFKTIELNCLWKLSANGGFYCHDANLDDSIDENLDVDCFLCIGVHHDSLFFIPSLHSFCKACFGFGIFNVNCLMNSGFGCFKSSDHLLHDGCAFSPFHELVHKRPLEAIGVIIFIFVEVYFFEEK
jgi:hypothetical protein